MYFQSHAYSFQEYSIARIEHARFLSRKFRLVYSCIHDKREVILIGLLRGKILIFVIVEFIMDDYKYRIIEEVRRRPLLWLVGPGKLGLQKYASTTTGLGGIGRTHEATL